MSPPPRAGRIWAHSSNQLGVRHDLGEHLRSTATLAGRFAQAFGAAPLASTLGLLHDAGKADCEWQARLLTAEERGCPVGGDHKTLGTRLLLDVAGPAVMTILGHHGGLGSLAELRDLAGSAMSAEMRTTAEQLLLLVPEADEALRGPCLIPDSWRDPLALEMGLRLTFSALVDADHLDTAAHFAGGRAPAVAASVDVHQLAQRFETRRLDKIAGCPASVVNAVRGELYDAAVRAAAGPPGLYRLPAPTGSGKTMTTAAFALHHAARHDQARVIVAVPFLTITEQNAQVYRDLLGADVVLEHHSAVDLEDPRSRLGAENWDAPFVVTTTVQLFDSLFGRKPARSRKLHRLANAVVVLDEVQSLPAALLVPLLDGLRLLTEHFGTTVLLASATQPAFQHLQVWRRQPITDVVADPMAIYERLRRVRYEWWLEPKPTAKQISERVADEHQALVVVNTVADARRMFALLRGQCSGVVRHLSTRMCPAHRRAVLDEVRSLLAADDPVVLVSTQLIEAGVDVDFPAVYRALAPADSLQQAAGRANREGRRPQHGRVVVFDAEDASVPAEYRTAVAITRLCFGPGKPDPDDLPALQDYYRRLYAASGTDHGRRATTIQQHRRTLDFRAVAEGPLVDAADSGRRDRTLAFRMLDDETTPVIVSGYSGAAAALLAKVRASGAQRDQLRALQPFTVALPTRLLARPKVAAACEPVVGDLLEWRAPYDPDLGIDEDAIAREMVR